jgi:hypothetical protein
VFPRAKLSRTAYCRSSLFPHANIIIINTSIAIISNLRVTRVEIRAPDAFLKSSTATKVIGAALTITENEEETERTGDEHVDGEWCILVISE